MDKLRFYLRLCRDNEKYVKLAVVILVVIAALVFFGTKGENEEIPVTLDGETVEQDISTETEAASDIPVSEAVNIVVDISGAVKHPGVYEIEEGSRLYEVLELAGGLTKKADTSAINQAEILYDGQKVLIPEMTDDDGSTSATGSSGAITSDGKVNLNLADSTELQEIPGVGPATAEKIVAYRESNGRFKSIEEIKNVSGIGDKTFEKIKDMITV